MRKIWLFFYDKGKCEPIKDEFLSAGTLTFNFKNKTAIDYVKKRNYTKENILQTIYHKYEWIDNKFEKIEIVEQIQARPNCERTITIKSN